MYSAVHDAASVVVKGLNIFLSNKTRVDMAIEFSPNQKCPLRSKKDSMAQAILDDFKKVECYLTITCFITVRTPVAVHSFSLSRSVVFDPLFPNLN